jgi:hypothetical protein
MQPTIIAVDKDGNPTKLHFETSFASYTKEYVEEDDGWINNQLDPRDFPAIRTGQDMLYLVNEVNRLRKELFRANMILNKF